MKITTKVQVQDAIRHRYYQVRQDLYKQRDKIFEGLVGREFESINHISLAQLEKILLRIERINVFINHM